MTDLEKDFETAGIMVSRFYNVTGNISDLDLLDCIQVYNAVLSFLTARGENMFLASSFVREELEMLEDLRRNRKL